MKEILIKSLDVVKNEWTPSWTLGSLCRAVG